MNGLGSQGELSRDQNSCCKRIQRHVGRIKSNRTGRSRQQNWNSRAAAQKRARLQRKDIWGIIKVVAHFYEILILPL